MPIANQSVRFKNDHRFTWTENDKPRNGHGGREVSAKTDDDSVARVAMLPGTIEVNVYQPDWRASGHIEATVDGENLVELHREHVDPLQVTGKLVVGEGVECSLADCELVLSAMDGKTQDLKTMRSNADGTFSLETTATKLGLFARGCDIVWCVEDREEHDCPKYLRQT